MRQSGLHAPKRDRRSRSRHSRPSPTVPSPHVEDELTSLAREAGSERLLTELVKSNRDEARSRGTVDQDPIIQEVPEYIPERRFVLVPNDLPTPPTSGDESNTGPRPQGPKLDTTFSKAADVTARTASPYAYTRPAKPHVGDAYFSSPNVPTPPPTDFQRRRRDHEHPSVASSRRDTPLTATTSKRDYFSAEHVSRDHASEPMSERSRRSASGTYSDSPKMDARTSTRDFATSSNSVPRVKRVHLDARRNTDTASTIPTLPSFRDASSRRHPSQIAVPSFSDFGGSAISSTPGTPLGPTTYYPVPRSREPSYTSSLTASPSLRPIRPEHTPPRSPRLSSDLSNVSLPASSPTSSGSSRPASPSPKTPVEPRLPKTEHDWSRLLAANAHRRGANVPPPRLAMSTAHEIMQEYPRPSSSGGSAPRTVQPLPYPDDAGPGTPTFTMPSETEHQYFAPTASLGVPLGSKSRASSRVPSPAASDTSWASRRSVPLRPSVPIRHSSAAAGPLPGDVPTARDTREVASKSSQTRKELAALLKKGLPSCKRIGPAAVYMDWYTVTGAPSLTFCPDCVDAVFERTVFRPSVRRLPQLSSAEEISCTFGSSAWMRLAWLLTLRQGRTDFTLLRDLASIDETSEPCPGSDQAERTWYGLHDSDGFFVKEFNICFADVRKIERMLPTLSGFFVPLPSRLPYSQQMCAMRMEGNRFSAYLDALIDTHERAVASRQLPDPIPFIALVERKTRLRECTRDNMLIGALWHFIPNIPTMTVCEDCFESVVEPEVQQGSDVALRFNQTVQPTYNEGMGTSCQLYSRRMREVFRRAVEDNDLRYLARKSRERREAELRLQERYLELKRKAKRLSRDGSGSEDDERRLNRELERLSEEWTTRWE
ncbi:hypothetical protein BAUCODRAFT_34015 [Baudoinia panamericana UAMH 10762]|uniref:Uncharacterized protein n=1 Tax=Baudoinia panamericana (strain UAMH 10762) TaxID=717646 RepID=M2NCL8_BAUPA|nr:uncharacterized protein BAUCODRAFT_34015 [Baudoinia panamericana UAMH 10762]EMC96640.1 hypothetical protein BAUCODRAFT_34015 [Baudoinia panamericana UAMH 10762]